MIGAAALSSDFCGFNWWGVGFWWCGGFVASHRAVSSLASFAAEIDSAAGATVSSLATVLLVLATTRCFFLVSLVAVPDLLEGSNRFLLRGGAAPVVASVAPEVGELVATLFLMRVDARLGLASTSGVPPLDVGDMVMQYL